MSSPHSHDDDDQRPRDEEPGGRQEPVHLGKGDRGPASGDGGSGPGTWQPPGWDLPPAEPERRPEEPPPAAPPGPTPAWGGRPRTPSVAEQVFRYQGDTVGAQSWALQHGWTVSDGTAPEDAVLAELVASAPVRTAREHRAAGVMRGRAGALDLVAFDVVFVDRRRTVPQWAVTAAPVLLPLPGLRLSPARFWRHRTGGLVPVPSGDEVFDARWVLLAAEEGEAVRRLVADQAVRGLLMGTDDGDEFWTAAGHLAAVRPDGHRPELLEHHARLLTAMVAALAGAA
ncbi:hypothetical protein SAMN05660464_3865 [Geodermatophilus dictyosporus]|uniref:Uncharacterized protein n=1 Tax=Geodermatophilus dictyosporus TaxID=1523247 RepID=A0A1I5S9D0_9ACTN|nr:hypothetical protein [Geodermatophilus dictyosporus]SFP67315.1 hypothetical protein SAMN05660464_3865 [Geodermatophilus dictyosporus]